MFDRDILIENVAYYMKKCYLAASFNFSVIYYLNHIGILDEYRSVLKHNETRGVVRIESIIHNHPINRY